MSIFAPPLGFHAITQQPYPCLPYLQSLYSSLFAINSPVQQQYALDYVNILRTRSSKLPVGLDITAMLIHCQLLDKAYILNHIFDHGDISTYQNGFNIDQHDNQFTDYSNCNDTALFSADSNISSLFYDYSSSPSLITPQILRYLYGMTIIRMVNGLVDTMQTTGRFAISVLKLASYINLPRELVEIRHESTHNELTDLKKLRNAANIALFWLHNNFWKPLLAPSITSLASTTTYIRQLYASSVEFTKSVQKLYGTAYPSQSLPIAIHNLYPKTILIKVTKPVLSLQVTSSSSDRQSEIVQSRCNTIAQGYHDNKTILEVDFESDFTLKKGKDSNDIDELYFSQFNNNNITSDSPLAQYTPQINKLYIVKQQFHDTPWYTNTLSHNSTTLAISNTTKSISHKISQPDIINFSSLFNKEMEKQLLTSFPSLSSFPQIFHTTPSYIINDSPHYSNIFHHTIYSDSSTMHYDNYDNYIPSNFLDNDNEDSDNTDYNDENDCHSSSMNDENCIQHNNFDNNAGFCHLNDNYDDVLSQQDIETFSQQLWAQISSNSHNHAWGTPHFGHLFFNKHLQIFNISTLFTDFVSNATQLSNTFQQIGHELSLGVLGGKRYSNINLVKIPKQAFEPFSITPPPPPMSSQSPILTQSYLLSTNNQPNWIKPDPYEGNKQQPHFMNFSPYHDSHSFFAQFQWLYDFIFAILEPNTPLPNSSKTDSLKEANVQVFTTPLERVLATQTTFTSPSILSLPYAINRLFPTDFGDDTNKMLSKKQLNQLNQVNKQNYRFQSAYTALSRLILPRFTQQINGELSTGAIKGAISELMWELYPDPSAFTQSNASGDVFSKINDFKVTNMTSLTNNPQFSLLLSPTQQIDLNINANNNNNHGTDRGNGDDGDDGDDDEKIQGTKRPLSSIDTFSASINDTSAFSTTNEMIHDHEEDIGSNHIEQLNKRRRIDHEANAEEESLDIDTNPTLDSTFLFNYLNASHPGNSLDAQQRQVQVQGDIALNDSSKCRQNIQEESKTPKTVIPAELCSNFVRIHREDELFSSCLFIYACMIEVCTEITTQNTSILNQVIHDKEKNSVFKQIQTSKKSVQNQSHIPISPFHLQQIESNNIIIETTVPFSQTRPYFDMTCLFFNQVAFDSLFELQAQINLVDVTGTCNIEQSTIDDHISHLQETRKLPRIPKKSDAVDNRKKRTIAFNLRDEEINRYKTEANTLFNSTSEHFLSFCQLFGRFGTLCAYINTTTLQNPVDLFQTVRFQEIQREFNQTIFLNAPVTLQNHFISTMIPPLLTISSTAQRSGILGWPTDAMTSPPTPAKVKKVHQQLYSQWSPIITSLSALYPGFQQYLILSLFALLLRIDWFILSNYNAKKGQKSKLTVDSREDDIWYLAEHRIPFSHLESISSLPAIKSLLRNASNKTQTNQHENNSKLPPVFPSSQKQKQSQAQETQEAEEIPPTPQDIYFTLNPQHHWAISIIIEWISSLVVPFISQLFSQRISQLFSSSSITTSAHTSYSIQFPQQYHLTQQIYTYSINWRYIIYFIANHTHAIPLFSSTSSTSSTLSTSSAPSASSASSTSSTVSSVSPTSISSTTSSIQNSFVIPLLTQRLPFLHQPLDNAIRYLSASAFSSAQIKTKSSSATNHHLRTPVQFSLISPFSTSLSRQLSPLPGAIIFGL